MRLLLLILSMAFSCCSYAQEQKSTDSTNRLDEQGKRTGMWLVRIPCPEGERNCSEFGRYDHGRKMGIWYKLNGEGELVAAENFRNDAVDGEVKYYESGRLVCIGHYRGMNPNNLFDTIVVVDPETGIEHLRQVSTDRGSLKHGSWRYFDEESGRLIKEEEYQVDNLLFRKEYPMSKSDSTYYAERNAKLPHTKKTNYTPPPSKDFSYINFK